MSSTADAYITIEASADPAVTLYKRSTDGKQWTVSGICDQRGDCLIGAVIDGFGLVTSHDDIDAAKKLLRVDRLISDLDVPVGPGDGAPGHSFTGCCPLVVTEL